MISPKSKKLMSLGTEETTYVFKKGRNLRKEETVVPEMGKLCYNISNVFVSLFIIEIGEDYGTEKKKSHFRCGYRF